MRILLIYPRFEKLLESRPELASTLHRYGVGRFRTPPALGIPILASLTPEDHELVVVDANLDPVPYDGDWDLVAISYFTPQATSAQEIGDRFRARGVPVVVGGMHPSSLPADAAAHADAVAVGEGEGLWPRILADAEAGELRRRYSATPLPSLAEAPLPRRDVIRRPEAYEWQAGLVQAVRGCPFSCEACSLPRIFGCALRCRPVDEVVRDVASVPFPEVYLADDTLMIPTRRIATYARELFDGLAPLGKQLFVTSTLSLDTDPELLRSMARAGVSSLYVVFGFDPVSRKALAPGASTRAMARAMERLARIRDAGIHVFASFGLGGEEQDAGVFDRILALSRAARLDLAEFFVVTPYPGTPLWDRVTAEDRLLGRPWREFNGAHVVHQPGSMTVDELERGFATIWQEFYAGIDPVRSLRSLALREMPR